jgi:hypothetical protein
MSRRKESSDFSDDSEELRNLGGAISPINTLREPAAVKAPKKRKAEKEAPREGFLLS